MNIELLAALAAFAFVMSITPGPNTMLLLASGVNHGFRATVPFMAGITAGLPVMLLGIGLGLGQVFVIVPWLYTALKVFSVVYLLWLAWKIATARPQSSSDPASVRDAMTFWQGAGFQWVNPKAWTLCLSIVSAYTVPDQYAASLLAAAVVFIIVSVPSVAIWALFGVSLRRFLQDPVRVRVFNVAMALALVASLWPLVSDLMKTGTFAFRDVFP
jgi:threonine/homoserine/homoserine lactone efflux protein